MAQSRIRLTFTDDNNGANDNDGYKVYRNIGSDPCPGGVIDATKLIHTHTSPTTGASVQFTDMTASSGNNYFYRVSFTRGVDEALSPNVVGPVDFPAADSLGYPNNVPSHTSGVTNFITTEPILHLDAAEEHTLLGGYNSYTGNLTNLADSYPLNIAGTGSQAHFTLSLEEFTAGGTQSAIPVIGYDPALTHYWAKTHSSTNYLDDLATAAGVTDTGAKLLIMDAGVTEVAVLAACEHSNGLGDTFASNSSHFQQFQHLISATHNQANDPATHSYTWSWTNKAPWQNPDPRAWMVGKDNYYMGQNVNLSVGATLGSGKVKDYSDLRTATLPSPATSWTDRLHVLVSRIEPDGSQKVFLDGTKLLDVSGPAVKNAISRWWDGAAQTGANEDYNIYPSIQVNTTFSYPVYGSCHIAETTVIPNSISTAEVLRMVAYVEDRYAGYIDTQTNYVGL